MKKGIFAVFTVTLLVLSGIVCFAQSTDTRVKALQGEWKVIRAQNGKEVLDYTVPPANKMEVIWKFEGNNFFLLMIEHDPESSEVATGTFSIVGNNLVMTFSGEKPESAPYTLQGNTLKIKQDGIIITLIKQ